MTLIHSVKEFSITFTNFPPSLIGIFSVVKLSEQILLLQSWAIVSANEKTLPTLT